MDKKFKKLVTFGCSFTEGHHLINDKVAWGDWLAKEFGIEHLNLGEGGSSNIQIMQNVIRFCEVGLKGGLESDNHDNRWQIDDEEIQNPIPFGEPSDYLIGIQLSELSRNQWWYEPHQRFWSTSLAALFEDWGDYEGWGKDKEFFQHMAKGKETIIPLEANMNLRRFETLTSIILIANYLENKGFKFFIFEGMNSILDDFDDTNLLESDSYYHFSPFLHTDYIKSLYNSSWFFNQLNLPMNKHMVTHPLYNQEENDNHPNSAYAEWYSKQLYKWLKE